MEPDCEGKRWPQPTASGSCTTGLARLGLGTAAAVRVLPVLPGHLAGAVRVASRAELGMVWAPHDAVLWLLF